MTGSRPPSKRTTRHRFAPAAFHHRKPPLPFQFCKNIRRINSDALADCQQRSDFSAVFIVALFKMYQGSNRYAAQLGHSAVAQPAGHALPVDDIAELLPDRGLLLCAHVFFLLSLGLYGALSLPSARKTSMPEQPQAAVVQFVCHAADVIVLLPPLFPVLLSWRANMPSPPNRLQMLPGSPAHCTLQRSPRHVP